MLAEKLVYLVMGKSKSSVWRLARQVMPLLVMELRELALHLVQKGAHHEPKIHVKMEHCFGERVRGHLWRRTTLEDHMHE